MPPSKGIASKACFKIKTSNANTSTPYAMQHAGHPKSISADCVQEIIHYSGLKLTSLDQKKVRRRLGSASCQPARPRHSRRRRARYSLLRFRLESPAEALGLFSSWFSLEESSSWEEGAVPLVSALLLLEAGAAAGVGRGVAGALALVVRSSVGQSPRSLKSDACGGDTGVSTITAHTPGPLQTQHTSHRQRRQHRSMADTRLSRPAAAPAQLATQQAARHDTTRLTLVLIRDLSAESARTTVGAGAAATTAGVSETYGKSSHTPRRDETPLTFSGISSVPLLGSASDTGPTGLQPKI